MEVQRKNGALLAIFLLAALASQAFVAVVESARSSPMEKASQDDVKKPDCVPGLDPHTFPGHGGTTTPLPSHGGSGTTPSHGGSGTTPSHGGSGTTPSHGGGYGTTPAAPSPSHGGSGTTPSHGGSGTTPSHGGGYGTTPAAPSPSHGGYGTTPSPSHGGDGTSPTTPSHGGYGTSPTAPSTGGGYGGSPTPSDGGAYGSSPTPSHGAYGGTTPSYGGSPTTPSHGGHGTATPTPLVPVDPNSPGTCVYWTTHPMEIWSAIGRWPSSVGHFFGTAGSSAAGGTDVSIQDALGNTRADGAGALLREGTAALLNSMTRVGFPYTTEQVRQAFAAAAGSDSAAATQAAAFKKANEGRS